MLNVLIHGVCGKMGQMLVCCAPKHPQLKVVCGVDLRGGDCADFPIYSSFAQVQERVDVVIDFSHASALDSVLGFCVEKKVPCVLASTGHTAEQKLQIAAAGKQIAVFYSANFSLGVNVLLTLCRRAAAAFGEDFDIEIVEKHHNQKVDAPSGTALMLADGIASVMEASPEYVYSRNDRHEARKQNQIGISAVRGGTIVGEHDVIFAGEQEVVTLSHTAYSREIFGNGALRAAVFVAARPVGLYNMESMIEASIQ